MLKYVKEYKKSAIMSLCLVGIVVITTLLQPRILQTIINEGIMNIDPKTGVGSPDMDIVNKYGIILIIIAVIGIIAGISSTIMAAKISQKVGSRMREEAFHNIQRFSFADLEHFDLSNVVVRLTNDVNQVQMLLMMMFTSLVRLPLLFIGSFILAVIALPKLWWIIILEVVLVSACIMVINKVIFPLFFKYQKRVEEINTIVKENFIGIRVIKSLVKEERETKKFAHESDEFGKLNFKIGSGFSILMPVIMLVANLSVVAAVFFARDLVVDQPETIGKLMSFISYLNQIMFALMIGGFLAMQASRASVSNQRIMEIIDFTPTITYKETGIDKINGSIAFNNVSFKYPNDDNNSLKNINFSVNAGELVGIVGATGSGKSSVVNLLSRLYDVQEGEILIDGVNVKDIPKSVLRMSIAYVLQRPILFSGTLESNIKSGNLNADYEQLLHASNIAQAAEFINLLPDTFNAEVQERGVNFSGGQKQRISIARGLIKNPSILILDDSTSALDANSERLVKEGLDKYYDKCTKVIISQKISSVVNANKILVLDEGELVAVGTHKELVQSCSLYQEIFNTQKGSNE